MPIKQVTEAGAELFTLAFFDDPTWSWAFPRDEPELTTEDEEKVEPCSAT